MTLRQLYFAVFYTWHRFAPLGRFDDDDELRSWGFVCFLQLAWITDGYLWMGMLTGLKPWRGATLSAVLVAAAVLAANYWALLRRDRWKLLAAEFDGAPATTRRWRMQVAWAVIVGTLLWTAITVYAHRHRASIQLWKPEAVEATRGAG